MAITLYDYLKSCEVGTEVTVWDKDYDIESYFYSEDETENLDSWDNSMMELAKLLKVEEQYNNGVVVNLAEVIENKLEDLDKADLFIECDIDSIMDDIMSILSGYVSENWLKKFVEVLKTEYFEAVEMCPHCESENVYPNWDVNEKGFVATCNNCGKEIFLCDECIHHEDGLNEGCCGCDWHKTEYGGKCFRGITRN